MQNKLLKPILFLFISFFIFYYLIGFVLISSWPLMSILFDPYDFLTTKFSDSSFWTYIFLGPFTWPLLFTSSGRTIF